MLNQRRENVPRRRTLYGLAVLMAALVLGAAPLAAEEIPLPENIHPVLNQLVEINRDPGAQTIAPATLAPLIEFLLRDKADGNQYAATVDGLPDPLVYHEFDVRQSLATILRYAFHPQIPSHVLALSSVRHSYWKEIDGRAPPFAQHLADRLRDLEAPLVIHGIEHEEISPDLHSGAYYSYDLERTLVMCRVAGRRVFISLARQPERSDVGRKGHVLGDEAWDYIYTGEKGIGMTGLGWVDSFMYDAFAAIVYVQAEDSRDVVRCGIFKWLRAGWNNINMVRSGHIRRGLERYAETFQEIVESPRLPAPSRVAAAARKIRGMSRAELQAHGRRHLEALETRYSPANEFPEDWYTEAVENGAYLEDLTRPQLEAMLFLDYMKKALGRHPERVQGDLPGLLGAVEP